ncbi:hypothetical protein C440_17051 [Haloferax mucosum ATCC BAA-1512]|uniref:Uncharacterized protein n=1 Tax=Haloferax mucosum ATCC BAA-1512 TaxID=662479 RepID=M0I279_9EURY|nr:hypothetical protein [Haloferax mucosum]ELZ90133.1 hypothetical protein C440_17051 [Haloferax mucosum ATCC BAA-1512]
MSDTVSALLTRTQRARIQSDFEDVEPAKRRRDQKKIRSRVAAGVADFELLATYPDRQYELAFDEQSNEALTADLADAYLTIERIRILNDIDRDDVITTAREHRRSAVDDGPDSLDDVRLRTRAERRRRIETELEAEYRPSRWKRLSDTLLKVGLALVAFVSVLAVVAPDFTNGFGSLPGIVGAGILFGGLAIVGVRAVKYDVLPAFRRILSDPVETLRTVWNQL